MEEKYEKVVAGATAVLIKNTHGYLCQEWNGIEWPLQASGQLAAASEEEAVQNLLNTIEVLDDVRDDPVRGPADALRRFDDQEMAAFLLLCLSGQIERTLDPQLGIMFRVKK